MTTENNKGSAAGAVKSAARALELLDEIATHGPGTQVQLSARLGIPRSSLHALLHTMTDRGWLQTDSTGSVYQLGIHSLVVSSAYLADDPVVARAAAIMDQISAATEETVNLGRLVGADVIYTAKRESVHPLRMHSPIGRRLPAYSTALGRAVLAELPREEREGLVPVGIEPLTARTVTDRDEVLALIDEAERVGYAAERDESCVGVRCFGVALPAGPSTVDGISVAVPMSRLDEARESYIVETLLSIKARLSSELDHAFVR